MINTYALNVFQSTYLVFCERRPGALKAPSMPIQEMKKADLQRIIAGLKFRDLNTNEKKFACPAVNNTTDIPRLRQVKLETVYIISYAMVSSLRL